jgi:hypothetical protein
MGAKESGISPQKCQDVPAKCCVARRRKSSSQSQDQSPILTLNIALD